MPPTNLPAGGGGNLVVLSNHLHKARLNHGRQCRYDQEYAKAWCQTIKAQASVQNFNTALLRMKAENPIHSVIALLTYQLGLARDEQLK